MSRFTMPLKQVIEFEGGKIGLDDYPIFDEDYRPKLNKKIIDHYWNQEIGQETIDMFRLALSRKMNEIMPLYNQHYKLGLLEIDPLSTMSIRSLSDAEANSTSNEKTINDTSTVAKSRAIGSDFPQTMLMDNGDYATNGSDNVSDATAQGTADMDQTTANTATQEGTTTGYQGHAPLLILQARQALVNVDMMVVNELQDLFMLIWSTDDSYSGKRFPYYGSY